MQDQIDETRRLMTLEYKKLRSGVDKFDDLRFRVRA
jgi:hypothetical protein